MIFYVLNSDEKLVETIQSPDESGVAGITAIQGVVEEKLSTYELIELIVPADSDGLEEIEEEMTIIFKDISGWREYIIYEIEDIDGDSLETTIRAELSSSELIDEVIERDIRGISNNPERNLGEILDGTRWLAGQVDSSLYSQPLNVDTNYMNVLEALNEYATKYGAEIRFRYEVDGNKVVRRYVDAYKQFGEYKGKIFEIDRDMTSVKRTVNTELIKTTIIPYSKELEKEYPEGEEPETKETYRIGIEDIEWKKSNGDPVDKPLGQNYLVDPVALERWGKLNADGTRRHKKIPMEFDFDNAEAIINMAWVQLGRYTQPRVSYEVSAIDLYAMTGDEDLKHEQILLGDTGGVKDHYFSNPLEIQTRLVEVKRDLFDPRNNDYVFGDPKTIFSANASVEVAEEMAKDMEDVITRIENAQISIDGKTKVFRGSEIPVNPEENDIWFRPHPSKQGHTQMMLFNGANWEIHVDSSDLEDAGRLTFGTIDGANINVINLIADNITGGQLKLENGIEITHKGIPILRVNNSGEVELNISKMTINAIDMEEELRKIHEDIENIELEKGEDGKSAYDIAVENGFEGTEQEWIHSLVGEKGEEGKTAYEIAVEEGFEGTKTEWLNSLRGEQGPRGLQGLQGPEGKQGIQGPEGKDGKHSYTHIAYATGTEGQSFNHDTFEQATHIGMYVSHNQNSSGNWRDYEWTLIKGKDGSQGIQGPEGEDGKSSYLHIAYAMTEDGKEGFSTTDSKGKIYVGTYTDFEPADSENPEDYKWTQMHDEEAIKNLTLQDKTETLSGTEIYTDKSDDSVVHVEIDGKSYQHAGSGKNLLVGAESYDWGVYSGGNYNVTVNSIGEYVIRAERGGSTDNVGVEQRNSAQRSMKLENGKRYTLSFDVRGNFDALTYVYIMNTGSSNQSLPSISIPGTNVFNRVSVEFTKGNHISEYSFIMISTRLDSGDWFEVKNIQIEEGSGATEYEPPAPTPDYPIPIESFEGDVVSSVGKRNLLRRAENRGSWTEWGSNTTIVNMGHDIFRFERTNLKNDVAFGMQIPPRNVQGMYLEKGKTYTLSWKGLGFFSGTPNYIFIMTNEGGNIRLNDSPINLGVTNRETWYKDIRLRQYELEFTVPRDIYDGGVLIGIKDGPNNYDGYGAYVADVKIEEGALSPYSPALEDTSEDNHPLIDKINLSLSEPLRSVGDVKDRLFRDSDGLWKVERNVYYEELDSNTPNWSSYTDYDRDDTISTRVVRSQHRQTLSWSEFRSSHFPETSSAWTRNEAGIGYSSAGGTSIWLQIPKSIASNLAEAKLWADRQKTKGTPIQIMYPLKENKYIETLDQELQDKLNNLRSFQDSNYVYTLLRNEEGGYY